MNKKLVVVSGTWYPLTMAHYFIYALRRREDVELITTGPFTGTWIPWKGGMKLDQKYVITPTYPLPAELINPPHYTSPEVVESLIESHYHKVPDLWLQIDAGFWFAPRPKATIVAHLATDPHCLLYNVQRRQCDFFFNMQKSYLQEGDIYLPYAHDPFIHKPLPGVKKLYDGGLIGAIYPDRLQLLKTLKGSGFNIYSSTGEVFEVYNERYNECRSALNISSLQDVNARTFEAMGQKVPLLTNRLPSLTFHFKEGEHYMGFDTVSEAAVQLKDMLHNPEETAAMAERAYTLVNEKHTYDIRISQMFKEMGLE